MSGKCQRVCDRLAHSLGLAKLGSTPAKPVPRSPILGRLWLGGDHPLLRGAALIFGLASALALASYAQYTIGRPLPGFMSPFSRLDEELVRIYGRQQSVLLAFGLFVGACVLFVASTRAGRNSEAPERWPVFNLAALWQGKWSKLSLGLFLGGAALWGFVVVRLWTGGYGESYPLLFGLSLIGLLVLFVRWDLSAGLRIRFRFHWWEPLLVAALCGAFFALNVRDLDGWRYAFIGDEGAFFNVAREIDRGATWNLFSQAGAYGDRAVGTSAYQAMVMKVFGVDYFGWKMASLLAIVAALPAFYVLMRLAFGARPAVFATAFLSASHYLFAYAHTGYDQILALSPVVAAFSLFFIGWRYSSAAALFAAGAVSGLGFYTFGSARAGIVILALFILTMGYRWWRPTFLVPIAIGFVVAVLPIFAVDKLEVLEVMVRHSAAEAEEPFARHLLENLPRSLFAFNYNPDYGHYLAGSLMDAASAVLAVLGLSYAVFRFRSSSYRFLVIWYVVALIVTGVFSTYVRVSFDRMHIVLPAMAAFAGIAVHRILLALEGTAPLDRLKPAATGLALVVLLPLVFAINVHRFWSDSAHLDTTHVFTVAVRAVTEGPCAGNGPGNVIVSEVHSQALGYVFGIYGLTDDLPTLLSYSEVLSGEASDKMAKARCVVLLDMDGLPARTLWAELRADRPNWQVWELTDLTGLSRVLVAGSADPG